MAKGLFSAEDLMRVICLKSLKSHSSFNCITEQFFEEAIQLAAEQDSYFRATGTLVGRRRIIERRCYVTLKPQY